MLLSSKCLIFSCLTILHQIEPFVTRNTVMQRSCCDWHLQRPIRNDLGFLPSSRFVPIDCEHVVRECLPENVITRFLWLLLLYIPWIDLDIFCLKLKHTKVIVKMFCPYIKCSCLDLLLEVDSCPFLQSAPLFRGNSPELRAKDPRGRFLECFV